MATTLDDFVEQFSTLESLGQARESYAEVYKRIDADQKYAAFIKAKTGEELNLIDENNPEVGKALGIAGRHEDQKKETVNYLRANIESILAGADNERLVSAAVFLPHKSEKYKALSELFDSYRDFTLYSNPKVNEGIRENALSNIKKRLPGIIKNRILENGKIKDEKEAEKWAMIVFSAARHDPRYVSKVINKEYERLEEALKTESKGNLKNYIMESLVKDEDYLRFGETLYQTYKQEKSENSKKVNARITPSQMEERMAA